MKKIFLLFFGLILSSLAYAENVTFDIPPVTNVSIIDSSLSGYSYQTNTSDYTAYFKNNSNVANSVRFEKSGYFFSFGSMTQIQWYNSTTNTVSGNVFNPQNSNAIINENIISYNDAWTNASLNYVLTSEGMKENIVIDSIPSSVSNNSDFLIYRLQINFNSSLKICNETNCFTSGQTFSTRGKIYFKNSSNDTIYYLPALIIQDNNGSRAIGTYHISVSNGLAYPFDILVPKKFLLKASYPVIIDPTVTFNTSGTTSWLVPANVINITVHVWGGGADGSSPSGGGGGGAYARSFFNTTTLDLTEGTNYTIVIGGANDDSWFKNSTTVKAKAGVGQAGGSATNSIGDVKYKGGNGGDGSAGGGGGGGAAGSGGDGQVGGNGGNNYDCNDGGGNGGIPGGGTYPGGFGGGGGADDGSGADGGPGGPPGGGGGGGASYCFTGSGGGGSPGRIIIEYSTTEGPIIPPPVQYTQMSSIFTIQGGIFTIFN